jgi:hypothetical protein
MSLFRRHLEEIGIADTRVWTLAHAADNIHSAVCALDHSNRELLARYYPAFLQLAEEFGSFDHTLRDSLGVDFNRATCEPETVLAEAKS